MLDEIADAATLGKTAGKDLAQGKATMVSILGLERAKAQAELMAEQAAGHLESFGEPPGCCRPWPASRSAARADPRASSPDMKKAPL